MSWNQDNGQWDQWSAHGNQSTAGTQYAQPDQYSQSGSVAYPQPEQFSQYAQPTQYAQPEQYAQPASQDSRAQAQAAVSETLGQSSNLSVDQLNKLAELVAQKIVGSNAPPPPATNDWNQSTQKWSQPASSSWNESSWSGYNNNQCNRSTSYSQPPRRISNSADDEIPPWHVPETPASSSTTPVYQQPEDLNQGSSWNGYNNKTSPSKQWSATTSGPYLQVKEELDGEPLPDDSYDMTLDSVSQVPTIHPGDGFDAVSQAADTVSIVGHNNRNGMYQPYRPEEYTDLQRGADDTPPSRRGRRVKLEQDTGSARLGERNPFESTGDDFEGRRPSKMPRSTNPDMARNNHNSNNRSHNNRRKRDRDYDEEHDRDRSGRARIDISCQKNYDPFGVAGPFGTSRQDKDKGDHEPIISVRDEKDQSYDVWNNNRENNRSGKGGKNNRNRRNDGPYGRFNTQEEAQKWEKENKGDNQKGNRDHKGGRKGDNDRNNKKNDGGKGKNTESERGGKGGKNQRRGKNEADFWRTGSYCSPCDRGFSNAQLLQAHIDDYHIACPFCDYSAPQEKVDAHMLRHSKDSEGNEIGSSKKEDCSWVASRKRNYPTKKRIEMKLAIKEGRVERGALEEEPLSALEMLLRNRFSRTGKEPEKKPDGPPAGSCHSWFYFGTCRQKETCQFTHDKRVEGAEDNKGKNAASSVMPKGSCFNFWTYGKCSKFSCSYRHVKQSDLKRKEKEREAKKTSLLKKLLEPEIQHHYSQVLQAIRFLVRTNYGEGSIEDFYKGVKLVEEKKEKIEEDIENVDFDEEDFKELAKEEEEEEVYVYGDSDISDLECGDDDEDKEKQKSITKQPILEKILINNLPKEISQDKSPSVANSVELSRDSRSQPEPEPEKFKIVQLDAQAMKLLDNLWAQIPRIYKQNLVYDSLNNPNAGLPKDAPLKTYYTPKGPDDNCLIFHDFGEGNNICKVLRSGEYKYDIIIHPNYHCKGFDQRFSFCISNTKAGSEYKFNIINLIKLESSITQGARPLMRSDKSGGRWQRIGSDCDYWSNDYLRQEGGQYYTLSFSAEFPADDKVEIAHSDPFNAADYQTFFENFENNQNNKVQVLKKVDALPQSMRGRKGKGKGEGKGGKGQNVLAIMDGNM